MNDPGRRRFLKVLAGAGAGALATMGGPVMRALAGAPDNENEFFIFIMAVGGWDVTLWSDPRNEAVGLVNPASTDNTDVAVIPAPDLWKPVALDAAGCPPARCRPVAEKARPSGWLTVFMDSPLTRQSRS